jgi:hypothetical protein
VGGEWIVAVLRQIETCVGMDWAMLELGEQVLRSLEDWVIHSKTLSEIVGNEEPIPTTWERVKDYVKHDIYLFSIIFGPE